MVEIQWFLIDTGRRGTVFVSLDVGGITSSLPRSISFKYLTVVMYARRSARYNQPDRPEVESARYSRYRGAGIKMQMITLSPSVTRINVLPPRPRCSGFEIFYFSKLLSRGLVRVSLVSVIW